MVPQNTVKGTDIGRRGSTFTESAKRQQYDKWHHLVGVSCCLQLDREAITEDLESYTKLRNYGFVDQNL